MADPILDPTRLEIHYRYNASRERVFHAWTQPDLIKQWFLPGPGFTTFMAEVDLRVGGRWRIGIRPPGDDRPIIGAGVYRQIQPPEKLVFTWTWNNDPQETLITLEFIAVGAQTELVLTHENFAALEDRDRHVQGWSACLASLDRVLSEQVQSFPGG